MIPEWNNAGVLPPIKDGEVGSSTNRSPYICNMLDVVERFSTSVERIIILEGLLKYREALYNVGAIKGFQWLDGSFVEDKEVLENNPPNDIDVVTFFYIPEEENPSFIQSIAPLFDVPEMKKLYSVDAYGYNLSEPLNSDKIKWATYWYGMWSHKRDINLWKGFLQVELSDDGDLAAKEQLEKMKEGSDIS